MILAVAPMILAIAPMVVASSTTSKRRVCLPQLIFSIFQLGVKRPLLL
jgi:hypothetical protein